MTARLMTLAFLALGAGAVWWGLTATHRRRLAQRVRAKPNTATVFTSPGCAACRTQQRIVASLEPEEMERIRYIDVTCHPEEATRFGVLTVPTTVLFGPDGTVTGVFYGVVETDALSRSLAGHG